MTKTQQVEPHLLHANMYLNLVTMFVATHSGADPHFALHSYLLNR